MMLVTGAAGFLGQHLVRSPASRQWEIVAPDSRSMDITDRRRTVETITESAPDVVVHLAYRKARRTIVDGTRNVAEGAAAAGAHLVHISTDVVFGGRAEPYREVDAPHPITDYGRDKADAELVVADVAPTWSIVRTSLLYGTDRLSPAQAELAEALRRGTSPMTYFSNEFRCPAHADDVAIAVARTAHDRRIHGILHVAGPDPVSRIDLARAMARHLGVNDPRLVTSTIAESGLVRAGERRPRHVVGPQPRHHVSADRHGTDKRTVIRCLTPDDDTR